MCIFWILYAVNREKEQIKKFLQRGASRARRGFVYATRKIVKQRD